MEHYDVVIIGGGIHGVGTAQASVAAGYKTLLLEKNALANGSSSRSSKLIHGGLRYLESAQFSLVHECLYERHLLSQVAPDLVNLEKFYIPVYSQTTRSRFSLRAGLSLYALLGGLKPSTRYRSLDKQHWGELDNLKQDNLKAVYQYYDGRTDDIALTKAVMHSAISLGAELIMPGEFSGALVEQEKVTVDYVHNGIDKQVTAGVLINATGPWVNQVLSRITPVQDIISIDLVQGAHLVLDNLPLQHCFYLEAPQDKRAIFLLPWNEKALLGTTETTFDGDLSDVKAQENEKQYLLDVLNHYFPNNNGVSVCDEFAGLRVLPTDDGHHFHKSRDTTLHRSNPRVISVYGGKLTTYRLVSERIIKLSQKILPNRKVVTTTNKLKLKPV